MSTSSSSQVWPADGQRAPTTAHRPYHRRIGCVSMTLFTTHTQTSPPFRAHDSTEAGVGWAGLGEGERGGD